MMLIKFETYKFILSLSQPESITMEWTFLCPCVSSIFLFVYFVF